MTDARITLFHAPQTRSTGAYALVEELGADVDLHILNLKAGELRQPGYLAINPMGKVPALRHGEALITEQGAVYLYLADHFAEAGLAPAIGEGLRGPFLRWLFFYGSSFEPALIDRALKRDPALTSMCPYGDYDTMLATLVGQLRTGPWLLGERFTAADVLWGVALRWTVSFRMVPELPEIMSYIARVTERPAMARALTKDAELAALQGEAAAKG